MDKVTDDAIADYKKYVESKSSLHSENISEASKQPLEKPEIILSENPKRPANPDDLPYLSRSSELRPKNLNQRQKLLGTLFIHAASLSEAMEYYTDEQLVKKFGDTNPDYPLHTRRTLDQAYYWTMDTKYRDRDQVVSRGTKIATTSNAHPFLCTAREENGDPCAKCTENVKKTPRVVMVDQLWMWILDESNYFITI
jgi:hypothetical protein